jgi:hypothetical protein
MIKVSIKVSLKVRLERLILDTQVILWVSLYFNHEQVRKGIKRSHMPVVGFNSFLFFSTFIREIN